MLYVFQYTKSYYVFCLLAYSFFFVGKKVALDRFEDHIIPSLKANNRLKFYLGVSLNHAREKGKLQYKLSYKLF